jgi:hypothetical protein
MTSAKGKTGKGRSLPPVPSTKYVLTYDTVPASSFIYHAVYMDAGHKLLLMNTKLRGLMSLIVQAVLDQHQHIRKTGKILRWLKCHLCGLNVLS